MTKDAVSSLRVFRRALLTAAGVAAFVGPTAIGALNAAVAFVTPGAEDRIFDASEIAAFLEFVPAVGNPILPRGVKARVKDGESRFTLRTLGLEHLVAAMRAEGPCSVMTKLPRERRGYFESLITRYSTWRQGALVSASACKAARGRAQASLSSSATALLA